MKLAEKIKDKKRLKKIKETVGLLKNECNIVYDNMFAEDAIYKSGQRYAEMMVEILEYYKTKNTQICEAVMLVVDKYGEQDQRLDMDKPRYARLTGVIRLIIPEEIGLKVKQMHNKMIKDKQADQTAFANKLDELAK